MPVRLGQSQGVVPLHTNPEQDQCHELAARAKLATELDDSICFDIELLEAALFFSKLDPRPAYWQPPGEGKHVAQDTL